MVSFCSTCCGKPKPKTELVFSAVFPAGTDTVGITHTALAALQEGPGTHPETEPIYTHLNTPKEASPQLTSVPKEDASQLTPAPAESLDGLNLYEEGLELHKDGKQRDAIKKYKEAITKCKEPKNLVLILSKLGKAHIELKEYHKAILAYKEAITNCKNSKDIAAILYQQGNAYTELKDHDNAILAYKEAFGEDFEDFADLLYQQGNTYTKQKDYDNAILKLNASIQIYLKSLPQTNRIKYQIAMIYYALCIPLVGKYDLGKLDDPDEARSSVDKSDDIFIELRNLIDENLKDIKLSNLIENLKDIELSNRIDGNLKANAMLKKKIQRRRDNDPAIFVREHSSSHQKTSKGCCSIS
jgi:tetratricopeptide (TPR) repeat protein